MSVVERRTATACMSGSALRVASMQFTAFAVFVLGAAVFNTDVVHGQESETSADIEEVIVIGFRQSQEVSLGIKRENVNFVDAIVAEDIGKLPDTNVAEALQRVSGVAIERSRGEGDFVSIRGLGPEFVRATINGRTMVSATESFDSTLNGAFQRSTGRETNFDVLPSEIVSALTVFKSTSAEQVEGGIGGVVDIKTASPLDMGQTFAGSYESFYSDFSEEWTPRMSGFASWEDDTGTFGGLISVAYSQREIREDRGNSFGYANDGTFGAPDFHDTNGDGTGDLRGTVFPFTSNSESFLESRDRTTFNGTLQWRPDDTLNVVVEMLHTVRNVNHDESQAIVLAQPLGTGTVNTDGSLQLIGLQARNDSARSYTAPFPFNIEVVGDEQVFDDTLTTIGVGVEKQLPNWILSGDFAYADAGGDFEFRRAVIVHTNPVLYNVDLAGGYVRTTPAAGTNLRDPTSYVTRNTDIVDRTNDDQEIAWQFDAERILENPFLSSVKFGVRWRSREKEVNDDRYQGTPAGPDGTPIQVPFTGDYYYGISGFLDGRGAGYNYSDVPFPRFDSWFNVVSRAAAGLDSGYGVLQFNGLQSFGVDESTFATYIQLDFAGSIGEFPLLGNVGLRFVSTEQDVTGYVTPFTLVQSGDNIVNIRFEDAPPAPFTLSESYRNVLPSANFRLALSDEVFVRVATSSSLTRPTFGDLSPELNINSTQLTASAGNPALTPYLATNFDLGIEWYLGTASAFHAGYFYKQIDDYIAGVTNLNTQAPGGGDVVFRSVGQPQNVGEAELNGFEIGFQQALEHLPPPFDGLGFVANVTTTDNSAEFDDSGEESEFPGVSEMSYNLTVYYDKGPLNARIAYSYRDDFLLLPSNVFARETYVNDYGQIDAGLNYRLRENITLFAEAINLNDSNARYYVDNEDRPLTLSQIGRRFGVGIRGRF